MKFKKTITILLAMTMVASAVAGCSEKKPADKDNNVAATEEKEPEETTVSDSKPAETEATEAKDEDTEASNTEIPDDFEILYPDDDFLDKQDEILSDYGSLDEAAYVIFNAKIDELHSENPDLRFQYCMYYTNEYPICWGLCAGEAGSDKCTLYLSDGKDTIEYDNEYDFIGDQCTYDEIKQYPLITDSYYFATKPVTDTRFNKVEDGRFFGFLVGISKDGSKAFVSLGEPYLLSEEEVQALKPGDTIKFFEDDPTCDFDEIVSDGFDGTKNGYLYEVFDYYNFSFDEESGKYMLLDLNEMPVTHNVRLAIVDFADSVKVEDQYPALYDGSDSQSGVFTNITDTYFFTDVVNDGITSEFFSRYNGWITCLTNVTPVVISNNQISEITFSWR